MSLRPVYLDLTSKERKLASFDYAFSGRYDAKETEVARSCFRVDPQATSTLLGLGSTKR